VLTASSPRKVGFKTVDHRGSARQNPHHAHHYSGTTWENDDFLDGLVLTRIGGVFDSSPQLKVGAAPHCKVNLVTRCVWVSIKFSSTADAYFFPFMLPVLVSSSGNPFTRFPQDGLANDRHGGLQPSVWGDLRLLDRVLWVFPGQSKCLMRPLAHEKRFFVWWTHLGVPAPATSLPPARICRGFQTPP